MSCPCVPAPSVAKNVVRKMPTLQKSQHGLTISMTAKEKNGKKHIPLITRKNPVLSDFLWLDAQGFYVLDACSKRSYFKP